MMSIKLFWTFLFSLFFLTCFGQNSGTTFNKNAYYKIFAGADVKSIDEELHIIQSASFTEKTAFEGALLMKKAGLVSTPKEKLTLFKEGRNKLETAISTRSDNVELRFLRLMIQENAPEILNYKGNILTDSTLITNSYKTLPISLQQVIYDYSKKSKALITDKLQ
jgi:hypothetical protein